MLIKATFEHLLLTNITLHYKYVKLFFVKN